MYAFLDIGSNSVRLMWGGTGRLRTKTILTTQLAEGLDASGKLGIVPMRRTAEAIRDLAVRACAEGADGVIAFATEAVRSASNGAEFVRIVRETAGVSVDVIDGETEAKCGFFGAAADVGGRVGVLDIGGASVELVVGERSIEYARSLPLGAVRLRDRYCGDFVRFAAELPSLLGGYGVVPPFDRLVGIGGTPTTLVAMARGFDCYDPERVHGSILSADEIKDAARRAAEMTTDELMSAYPTLVRRRAEVIPYGAMLLAGLVAKFGFDGIVVSEKDNLEGYAALRGYED